MKKRFKPGPLSLAVTAVEERGGRSATSSSRSPQCDAGNPAGAKAERYIKRPHLALLSEKQRPRLAGGVAPNGLPSPWKWDLL
ncbi:uncharacterized [Tachysurus ichikawai]